MFYPNYQIFSGQPTTNKSGTVRFTVTSKSIDCCSGKVHNRDMISTVPNSWLQALEVENMQKLHIPLGL